MTSDVKNKTVTCTIRNVLFVVILSYNLILVSVMACAGLKIVFKSNFCDILFNDRCIAQESLQDIHYYLKTADQSSSTFNVI